MFLICAFRSILSLKKIARKELKFSFSRMPVDMDDEIDVQIHFLVFEYLKKTHKNASKVVKIKFRNFEQFLKVFWKESKLDLTKRPKNLGTLEGWWRDFERSEFFDG